MKICWLPLAVSILVATLGLPQQEALCDDAKRDLMARPHHSLFAHKAFLKLLFDGPSKMTEVLVERGEYALVSLWTMVGDRLSPDDRMPSTGLALSIHELKPGLVVYLITLPPPERVPEAYFGAAVLSGGKVRYWTLERTFDGLSPGPVLGEWISDGSHLNHGRCSGPEKSASLSCLVGAYERITAPNGANPRQRR